MSERKLEGKVAVVTGGSSGIGLAAARLFHRHGAKVVIVARREATLVAAREVIGDDATALSCDVSMPDQVQELMQAVGSLHGRIDVLFANAGVSECPDFLHTSERIFDEVMASNIKSVFYSFTHAFPLLAELASVIFTSSVAQQRGRPGDPLYSATKAAVRSFARTMAADERVLARKIRINVISPGAIRTPMTNAATDDPAIRAWVEAQVPMGRWGEPEEVAHAALFLASADASYLTAGEIAVDGGLGQI
jgi:NAD(P)-dependent dehydrogenase (short-subunit alcohol dehydrogenase family)